MKACCRTTPSECAPCLTSCRSPKMAFPRFAVLGFCGRSGGLQCKVWGKKKINKHKEFWRDTPWFVSRLSRGHVPSVPSVPRTFCPLNVSFHINQPKRPGCPWDVPNLSPGRSRGIPTTKFLYVIFLYRFFGSESGEGGWKTQGGGKHTVPERQKLTN